MTYGRSIPIIKSCFVDYPVVLSVRYVKNERHARFATTVWKHSMIKRVIAHRIKWKTLSQSAPFSLGLTFIKDNELEISI